MNKRNTLLRILIVAFIFFIPATAVFAQGNTPPIPPSLGYLSDYAGECSVGQVQLLETTLRSLEEDTGAEVAVVTMADCGEDPVRYRGDLFNEWGVGKAGTDNGLLILACIEQRSLEQETGYAMEVTLPDLLTRQAAEDHFVPQAKNGEICQGLVNIVQAYDPVIRGDEYVHAEPTNNSSASAMSTLILLIVIILVLLVLIAVFSDGSSGGYSSSSSSSSWSSSSSSSSSSSGSSWGGGSSGGGGSSTSW